MESSDHFFPEGENWMEKGNYWSEVDMIRPFKTLCGCLSGSEKQMIVLIHQTETDKFKYGICASMPPAKISCFN